MTLSLQEQELTSNGFILDPSLLAPLQSTDPSLPVHDLQHLYREQGYLWLKGILQREAVLDFRERVFSSLADAGLLRSGSSPRDGLYSGEEDRDLARKRLMELVRWAAYEAFCLSPAIWRFYEAFLEGAVYLHRRKIVRYTRPGDVNCTGAHYDLTYLRGGTDTVCTSWIPMGDIPAEMGGLVYLAGSDSFGREAEADYRRRSADLPAEEQISAYNRYMSQGGWLSKDLPALARRLGSRWLYANYEAGDMVVHSAYMIHAATANRSPEGRLRLSTDIRYQRVRDEIDARWQNHWSLDDML